MEKKSEKRIYDKNRQRSPKKKLKISDDGRYGEDADDTLMDLLGVDDVRAKLAEYEVIFNFIKAK